MSSTFNRNWICWHLKNKNISPSDEYEKGVKTFLEFSKARGMNGKKTKRPCNTCKNGYFFKIEEVKNNLFSNEFLENY